MRADVVQELRHGGSLRQRDLPRRDGARGEELGGLALERVQGVETEQLVQGGGGLGAERGAQLGRVDGVVEVLHDQVLRVGGRQAPELNQERVPRALLDIAVLERLEGEVGRAPGERVDDVLVLPQDVERGTLVAAGQVVLEDTAGVVVGGLAGKNGTSGFEELHKSANDQRGEVKGK